MKPACPLSILAVLAALLPAGCASNYKTQPAEPAPVKSVTTVAAPPAAAPEEGGDQRLYGGATALPQQQHAGSIIDNFRPVYEKLGKPRLMFYINRDLKGDKQPATTTTTMSTRDGKRVVTTKTDEKPFNLADKQTARDIERIAGAPFRQAGATLADPAALETGATDAAPPADVAIETFVTSRQVSLPSISGAPETVTIPDIQMTAIRLSDCVILGQATANDIVSQLPPAALGSLGVHDALEATALNLMSDITARAK